MIKTMLISGQNIVEYGGVELVQNWRDNPTTRIWLDITGEPNVEETELLTSLGCHALAISDAQRERHPPKLELFKDYLFFLYRGIKEVKQGLEVDHLQINFFVGKRILISRHNQESLAINSLFNETGERFLQRSPVHLATRVFHNSCGFYIDLLINFESELEAIEDEFQLEGTDTMMRQITQFRSRLIKLRRTFNYHVNVGKALNSLIDDEDTDLITSAEIHPTNDLNERLDRLLSLSQMYYDICSDLVDGYMSVTSHQLNATMRVLTVITAIFVPLSFLAGLYGMNFEYIPELKAENGYFILLGTMLTIATGLIVLFKKKNWL
jgi:magnesium transporter